MALVGVGTAAAAASRPGCSRDIVQGNLDGDVPFTAREVIVYAPGVFPGNPMLARVAGDITAAGWYSVRLPGLRAPDQLRVVGAGADVGAYFVEDGRLNFYVALEPGSVEGTVSIFYIPGSATWSHHFELDVEKGELALVARVDWPARTMFRNVDLLLVSGKLHTAPPRPYPVAAPAAAGAGGSFFDFSGRVASPSTDTLAAFTVPSSTDTGIYVVHRSKAVDIPGSNAQGLRSCAPAGFYLRVYESPLEATEIVVADDGAIETMRAAANSSASEPVGPPLVLELKNSGDLPWMSGRADIYKDGILAGADSLPYVPRNGTARLEMGWAFDVRVTRTTEVQNGTKYQNFTVTNLDVTPYTVEVTTIYPFTITDLGPFVRVGDRLTARGTIAPATQVTFGWSGPA